MPTIREVAAAAEVSLATASRVLSGTRRVTPELAERVLAASRELGYRTNLVARGLRRQRTDTVGLVVPRIANPFFARLVQELTCLLQPDERVLLVCDAQDSVEVEAEALHALVDRQVDGLIVVPSSGAASRAALTAAAANVRLVQVDRVVRGAGLDLVAADHAAGIDMVLDHLAGCGWRRTLYVGASEDDSAGRERLAAYRRAVADGRTEPLAEPLLGSFSVAFGQQAGAALVRRALAGTAVVAGNDLIALGLLDALHRAGVAVPEEVAVTGFDDVGFTDVSAPPLTTVRQPVAEIAAGAVELVLAEDGPREPVEWRFRPHLVVRRSTDPRAQP